MSCCDFEPEIKFECVTEIIKLLRSGDMDRNKTLEIAKQASCFIGSGAAMLQDSDEDLQNPIGNESTEADSVSNDAADQLEALLPTAEGPVKAVPWLAVIRILLPILLSLLKDEK